MPPGPASLSSPISTRCSYTCSNRASSCRRRSSRSACAGVAASRKRTSNTSLDRYCSTPPTESPPNAPTDHWLEPSPRPIPSPLPHRQPREAASRYGQGSPASTCGSRDREWRSPSHSSFLLPSPDVRPRRPLQPRATARPDPSARRAGPGRSGFLSLRPPPFHRRRPQMESTRPACAGGVRR